ncbi:alpha-2-macroglobulin family protein [Parapedobacter sp.]
MIRSFFSVRTTILVLSGTLFLMAPSMAQQHHKGDPFQKEWTTIDSLSFNGLPKSAMAIARKIKAAAQQRGDNANTIKATLFLIAKEALTAENESTFAIQQADSMIRVSDGPEKALWQSIAAELYWQYYQRNRWTILDRTPILGEPPVDIATWDAASLIAKASDLYQVSILNSEALKAIPVERYAPMLTEGINTRRLRPTLYDLLAFRAIGFFQNDEKDVIKPAYQFQIDGKLWFEPAARLAEVKVNPATPEALHFRALHTYQQLLAFHLDDEQPDALIDADLQRLQFVHQYSIHPDKDSLYRAALQALAARYADSPAGAQAAVTLFQFDFNQSQGKDSIDRQHMLRQLDALIVRFPGSEGARNAEQLRYILMSKLLQVQTESVLLPAENSKVLINYRNLDKVYLRIYPWPTGLTNTQRDLNNSTTKNKLLRGKPLSSWHTALPGSEDLYEHRTEIKVDPLPTGRYLLVASATADFSSDKTTLSVAPIQVSSLSLLTNNLENQHLLFALHRKSGMPIRGAKVTFLDEHWDNTFNAYRYEVVGKTTTDEDGKATIHVENRRQNIRRIVLSSHGDTLRTDGYFGSYRAEDENEVTASLHTFLFTDRAIYRPGQTVYFKGIVVENAADGTTNRVMADYATEVTLLDANDQEVASMELTTNGYGSFSGKFIAPASGLTGQMHIKTANGNAYFAVEEYKRPKFEVVFDTLKANIALNEEITLKGHAAAYAGSNIDGAAVRYRVVRHARFPYFWAAYRWGQPQSPQMEIANGTVQTQADGSFEVTFTTIPDKQIDPHTLPVFMYSVYADVTDINGETQSGSQTIQAGYRSLLLNASMPRQLDASQENRLTITTQNLNGIPTPADVAISVAPLTFPGKLYRERMWEKPDRYTMTEQEFRQLFPDDEYANESNYMSWATGETSWSTALHTAEQQAVEVPASAWQTKGWHVITLTTADPRGNEIIEKIYTYAAKPATDAKPQQPLLVWANESSLEPGEVLDLTVKTGFDSTYVLETNTDVKPEFTTFSERRQINRSIDEDDRGGLGFTWLYVHNNRVYQGTQRVDVPWSNRDLQLEWATHRDKLQPGAAEEWQLTIKGNKKETIAAELLAGLYDASLDALRLHRWNWNPLTPNRWLGNPWGTHWTFKTVTGNPWLNNIDGARPTDYEKRYDELLNYPAKQLFRNKNIMIRGLGGAARGVAVREESLSAAAPNAQQDANQLNEVVVVGYGTQEKQAIVGSVETAGTVETGQPTISLRTNLEETAFFFPQLQTDAEGNVTFKFTMPEALTEWRLMAFAHTTDWKTGFLEGKIKTQKDLIVMPNLPRFLRQGDQIRFSAKVSNISTETLRGTAYIELLDATTGQRLSALNSGLDDQSFAVAEQQSTDVAWTFAVPDSLFNAVVVRISAKAGNFTDGEETTLPVITNRMLVTETLPLPVRGNTSKTFTLDKLANTTSDSRVNHALTVEFTGNPAWYAVQALPYLMEYPYECAEQTFNRFYANALAAHIVDQAPRVKAIFEQWKTSDTTALLSNLEKNQELKSALLEETPWVMEAKSEREQKHRIAQLFENHKLAQDLQQNLAKLAEMQLSDGSFPWFRGMSSNRYITQYIATGIARLQQLGVEAAHTEIANEILAQSVDYVDREVKNDHDYLVKNKMDLSKRHLRYTHVQYLYMRSLVPDLPIRSDNRTAYDYFLGQAADYWNAFNPYLKGQLALALHRADHTEKAAAIMASLRETAVHNDELGMYWKAMPHGYWWYEAPIEAQALLIEAFAEVADDQQAVDDLKVWLIKQKQTLHWNTTKATADAIYALLLQGSDWLVNEPDVTITLGNETIRSTETETEAGTGYFKKRYEGPAVTADMGNIAVKVAKAENEGVAWGAVYWQYFEDLDKITNAETPLSLRKQLYIQRNTDRGPVLEEINANNPLQIGDKVTVRIELRVDRDMEYVHLKDMRAACFEPINVLSGYRYQGGLGYYESTRDVATNFFFDYLRKGTYVFEYPVFVAQAGDFSNGISTIQCMYAPEFSSHSEGIRVQVKQK